MTNIGFIGFGEAANAFADVLTVGTANHCRGYDIKSDDGCRSIAASFNLAQVQSCNSVADAVHNADLVFSLVEADQACNAADKVALSGFNRLYLDGNSCSPGTKRRNAKVIEAAGGSYIDLAIMAPVLPDISRVSLLLSGAQADEACGVLVGLGLNAQVAQGGVGAAASVKMIRSILVKGLEAVLTECTLAGVQAGVDEQVFSSLEKTYPGFDWSDRAKYMLERMVEHGTRRAAEMVEVKKTVAELGLPNGMSSASIEWHARMGQADVDIETRNHRELANRVIDTLREQ